MKKYLIVAAVFILGLLLGYEHGHSKGWQSGIAWGCKSWTPEGSACHHIPWVQDLHSELDPK